MSPEMPTQIWLRAMLSLVCWVVGTTLGRAFSWLSPLSARPSLGQVCSQLDPPLVSPLLAPSSFSLHRAILHTQNQRYLAMRQQLSPFKTYHPNYSSGNRGKQVWGGGGKHLNGISGPNKKAAKRKGPRRQDPNNLSESVALVKRVHLLGTSHYST